MKDKKIGSQTLRMSAPPIIIGAHTVAGRLESEGPLCEFLDVVIDDGMYGQLSFEKAEAKMMQDAVAGALQKSGVTPDSVDFFIASDLLDQIVISNTTAAQVNAPYLGLYSACTATSLCLSTAAMLIDGGYASKVVLATSSHNSTAERQYRYPTEYGVQRPPYAQWTTTGAGSAVLSDSGIGPKVTFCTMGKVIDTGMSDVFNMGAAMAPAALDTIAQHLTDTGRDPSYYDLIVTGDLGRFGHQMLRELASNRLNLEFGENLTDCGILLYRVDQGVDSGGSGCGCSALVVFGYIFKQLQQHKLNKVLVVATGALHSPTISHQGGAIPSIAHAVSIEW